jgi:hypothetical protein
MRLIRRFVAAKGPSCGTHAGRLRATRQPDDEFGVFADLAVDPDCAAVLLGHDIVADREAESGALAGRLGREEWLEQLFPDFGRNADAVVTDADFNGVPEIACRHGQDRPECPVAVLPQALVRGVEAIAKEVQKAALGDLLNTARRQEAFIRSPWWRGRQAKMTLFP